MFGYILCDLCRVLELRYINLDQVKLTWGFRVQHLSQNVPNAKCEESANQGTRYVSRLNTLFLSTNMVCLSAGNRKKRRRKEVKKTWLCAANFSSAWHTRLSGGAPDSVWCARLVWGELAALGTRRRCTAIIHRTVRWCTRLSGEPTVVSDNGRPCDQRATRGQANDHLILPDCPMCTGQCPVR
jgi:hypothetical protein